MAQGGYREKERDKRKERGLERLASGAGSPRERLAGDRADLAGGGQI